MIEKDKAVLVQSWLFHTHTQAVRVVDLRCLCEMFWLQLSRLHWLVSPVSGLPLCTSCLALLPDCERLVWLWIFLRSLPACLHGFPDYCLLFLHDLCTILFLPSLAPCSLRTHTHTRPKKRHGVRVAFIQNHRDLKRTAECLIVFHT